MKGERIDTRLHRYFDGDLSPAEAAELRQRVEQEPILRAKLDGLREIRALVRASAAPAVDELPSSDDLWSRIEAGIAGGKSERAVDERRAASEARPGLVAVEGGAGGSAPERAARAARAAGPTSRAAKRHRWAGIAIAGVALAAAVLLIVVRPGEAPDEDPAPIATTDPTHPAAPVADEPGEEPAEEMAAATEQVFRTEVLAVDFGENSGAIFAVEGDDGERYAVVWLADIQPKPPVVVE